MRRVQCSGGEECGVGPAGEDLADNQGGKESCVLFESVSYNNKLLLVW